MSTAQRMLALERVQELGAAAVPELVKLLKIPGASGWAACALGWIGEAASSAIPDLAECVAARRSPEDAASALGSMGPEAFPALLELLRSNDAEIRFEVLLPIASMDGHSAAVTAALMDASRDSTPRVRQRALWALGGGGVTSDAVLAAITSRLIDTDEDVSAAAFGALRALGGDAGRCAPLVAGLLESADERIRARAAETLGAIAPDVRPYVDALREASGSQDERTRAAAVEALAARSAEELSWLLHADPAAARAEVMHLIARSRIALDVNQTAVIDHALDDVDARVREAAARALSVQSDIDVVDARIVRLLTDPDPDVRAAAADLAGALPALSPQVLDVLLSSVGGEPAPAGRARAAAALGKHLGSNGEIVAALVRTLATDAGVVASEAAERLAVAPALARPRVVAALEELLRRDGIEVASALRAWKVLVALEPVSAAASGWARSMLESSTGDDLRHVAEEVGNTRAEFATDALLAALNDAEGERRRAIVRGLAATADQQRVRDALLAESSHPDPQVREAAVGGLHEWRADDAVRVRLESIRHDDASADVRDAAATALRR